MADRRSGQEELPSSAGYGAPVTTRAKTAAWPRDEESRALTNPRARPSGARVVWREKCSPIR